MIAFHCAVSPLESAASSILHSSPLFLGAALALFMCCMIGHEFGNIFRN